MSKSSTVVILEQMVNQCRAARSRIIRAESEKPLQDALEVLRDVQTEAGALLIEIRTTDAAHPRASHESPEG